MLKVMTVVGTRPELIKLSRVIHELGKYTDHKLVHSGQNYDYELNEIFFRDLSLPKPDYFLGVAGDTAAQTIGNTIIKLDEALEAEKPDAVLFYGDTNTCMGVIAAKRRKIPIFHMEAGNRCFDQRVPEELNRKVLDHLSDINMPLTEHARQYLIAEGIRPETVVKTGSAMKEVLAHFRADIDASSVLMDLKLEKQGYFVVSAHREENIDSDENLIDMLESISGIAKHYDKKVIVSTHPRTQKRIDQIKHIENDKRVNFMKPLGFHDYVNLQLNSFCTISDSGTITEESSILEFPAIMLRQAHERPEGMDEGTLIMSGLKKDDVIDAIDVVTKQYAENPTCTRIINDYNVDNVSTKVVRIILSYVNFVNRTVWKKNV